MGRIRQLPVHTGDLADVSEPRWSYITDLERRLPKPHTVVWLRDVLPDGQKRLVVFADHCYATAEEALAAAALLEAEFNVTAPRSFASHRVGLLTISPTPPEEAAR